MDAIRPRQQRLRRPFGARRVVPTRTMTVWQASSVVVRCAAVVLAVVAIASTVTSHVPVAGAVAVVLLVPAALVDLHTRRLPDALVLTAGVAFVAVALMSTLMGGRVDPVGIVAGAVVMTVPLLALHLISPASMGFGDVKATLVLGAALGAVDWQLALVGLALAAGLGATVGVLRGSRTIPFGPFLVAAAAIALVMSPVLLTPIDTSNAISSAFPATISMNASSMNTSMAATADFTLSSTITGSLA